MLMQTKNFAALFLLCLFCSIPNLNAQVSGDVTLPVNSFVLGPYMTVNYEFGNDNTITMAIKCTRPNQYFGIGHGSTTMTNADLWVFEIMNGAVRVTDYFSQRSARPTSDIQRGGQEDLETLGYEITAEYTLVKVRRVLNTGDQFDVPLEVGPMDFIWATGSGNAPTMAYHTRPYRGEATIELIANPEPEPEEEEEEEIEEPDGTETNEDGAIIAGDIALPTSSATVGDFLTINYEFNTDDSITMVIKCSIPDQFFALGFGTSMIGSDVWVFEIVDSAVVATDYYSTEQGDPTKDIDIDGSQENLEVLGYEIASTYTLVKVKRALNTGDASDKIIQEGRNNVIYATTASPTLSYHSEGQRGGGFINLVRPVVVPEEEEVEEVPTEPEEPVDEQPPVGEPGDGEPVDEEEPTEIEEPPVEEEEPTETGEEPQDGEANFGDITAPANTVTLAFLTISYEVIDNVITMLIKCTLPGQFFALGFGEGMRDSDVWLFEIKNSEVVVGDYFSTDYTDPQRDDTNSGQQDLERLGYEITPEYTLVKVRRALVTGDPRDKIIRIGDNSVIYATTASPIMSPHGEGERGMGTLTLVASSTQPGGEVEPEPEPTDNNSRPGVFGDISLPSNYFQVANLLNVYFEFTQDGSIIIAFKCNKPGQYFGIGFGNVMTGTDMWVFELVNSGTEVTATDYKGLSQGPPTKDVAIGGREDLELLGYEITPSYTLVKVKRSLDTGDANDFILYEGWVDMIYATAPTRFMTKHSEADRGFVTVPFIEGTQGFVLLDASSNTTDIHGILNLLAWGLLVDIGIIAVRILRGRKFTFGNVVISAQLIHSAIMWLVFLISITVSAMLLNKNRSTRGDKLTGEPLRDFHYINGVIMMFLSVMTVVIGIASMLYLKSYKQSPPTYMNVKKVHKYLGYLMYAGAKINIIVGAIFHKDGAWRVPVFVYLAALFFAHLLIQKKYTDGFRFSKKVRNVTQKPSRKPKHIALMNSINNGVPREKLLLDFPNIKWVQLGNKVYDVTDWTHPGGNFIIQACVGREVGRFLYGNYALESTNMKPHKHSALALSQLNNFYIGEVTNYESILLSKNGQELVSRVTNEWKIASIQPVSSTVSRVDFMSKDIRVKNFGTSLSWLSRHFAIGFAQRKSHSRIYTIALSLNEANIALRKSMFKYFDEIMAGEPADFNYDSSYLEPQPTLPVFIKNYSNVNGLSKAIHRVDLTDDNSNFFRIEGPMSRGLEIAQANSGTQTIVCAGTGLFPFIDFLNFFLWKNMYELVKKKAGKGKAQEMNILNIPFENYMNGLRINFFGSFANEQDILGLDIINKLAEISEKYDMNNFNAMIRGYSNEYIPGVKESFSIEFLKKHVSLTEERFYIVGPPRMNTQVPDALKKLGVSEERIVLV